MDQGRTFIKGNLHNITNAQGQTVLVAQWQPLTTHGMQGLLQNSSGREAASFPLLAQHAGCSEELCLWPLKLHADGLKATHSSLQQTSQALPGQSSLAMFLPLSPKGLASWCEPSLIPVWEFSRVPLGPVGSSWFPTRVEWRRPWVKMLEHEE